MDGDRLPSERDLAKQYNTTIRTLRKALRILDEKGLLRRIQGSGNYIQAGGDTNSVYSMFRLELISGGGLPTAHVISTGLMEKPHDLPAFGTCQHATRIRRLRYLNRHPIAIEEIWLDGNAGRIDSKKLKDSLYLYYKNHLGFWITHAEDFVSIAPTPAWAPTEFAPPIATIVGLVERFSFANDKGCVEFSRTWFDPNTTRYVQRLK